MTDPVCLGFRELDLSRMQAVAAAIADAGKPGDVYCLSGPLGIGKTAFAKELLKKRGVTDEVVSPTFNLVLTYETAASAIWHIDLYRLEGPDEIQELGLEEGFDRAIMVIEWPDRLGAGLPPDRIDITFSAETDGATDPGDDEPLRRIDFAFYGSVRSRLAAYKWPRHVTRDQAR